MRVHFQFREVFCFGESAISCSLWCLSSVLQVLWSCCETPSFFFLAAFMWASQVARWVNNLYAIRVRVRVRVQSLGQEHPLEEGMATLSSILACRIPWTEEPGGLWSMGSQRVRHNWSDLAWCVCVCVCVCVCACAYSCLWLFVTQWTIDCQAPLSFEFSRIFQTIMNIPSDIEIKITYDRMGQSSS